MAKLVQRVRQVVAAEDDDFFNAETILYYLNKAQDKVISYMVNQEKKLGKSLRALDELKNVQNVTPTAGNPKGNYFEIDIDFPSDLQQFVNLVYNKATILRELSGSKLYLLEWGNLVPTQYEGYFYITSVSGTKTFRLYLHENPDGTSDELDIFYIITPTEIADIDESLAELPDQLENAVIYGAAMMMAAQELSEGTKLYSTIYEEELQANLF